MRAHTFSEVRESYSFVLPLLIFIGCFVLIPVLGTFVTSAFQDVTFLERRFVLLANYRQLLLDSDFWNALRFTILFIVVSVPLEMVLGLGFALALSQPLPARGLLRCCVLIPWAIPAAISARTWELIYNYHFGLANFLFTTLGISEEPVNWLGSTAGAFCCVVVADAWKTTPFVTIILLAGLSTIPTEVQRQAQVDGASYLGRFWRVTLPLLKPTLIVALLFRTIDGLRIFDLVYVLTHGGPGGATTSLSLYGYKYFLGGDFGYGSSVSVVLFIVAFALAVLYLRLSRWSAELT